MNLTKKYLHELFNYVDGKLFWKVSRSGIKNGKKEVTSIGSHGYLRVGIDGQRYLVHRVIWAMHYEHCPKFLDHINGVVTDNRIENLRPTTLSTNGQNRKKTIKNKSGEKNICFDKKRKKWAVSIIANKKRVYFARFDDFELAKLAAVEARIKFHKQFARHN